VKSWHSKGRMVNPVQACQWQTVALFLYIFVDQVVVWRWRQLRFQVHSNKLVIWGVSGWMCGSVPQLKQGYLEVGNAVVCYLSHFLNNSISEIQIPGSIHVSMLSFIWHGSHVALLYLGDLLCLYLIMWLYYILAVLPVQASAPDTCTDLQL
jgi:hypothetical protein